MVWWSGIGAQNPFTTDGVAATGAVPMPSLLLGVGAVYHFLPNLSVFFEPTFFADKPERPMLLPAGSSPDIFDGSARKLYGSHALFQKT